MEQFRRLLLIAILAGAAAGLVRFAVQQVLVVPLIEAGEIYEAAAPHLMHADTGWEPAPGLERTGLTAIGTVLVGIGFAAVLASLMSMSGGQFGAKQGVWWGLAGFVCAVLAPAAGLPPAPPGAAEAALGLRQFWWAGTVAATALGLYLMVRPGHGWLHRVAGLACIALPHLVGAPVAPEPGAVPPALLMRFALASVFCGLVFWLATGILCGLLLRRHDVKAVSAA
jgi:cobalt transporter subunit CbtA